MSKFQQLVYSALWQVGDAFDALGQWFTDRAARYQDEHCGCAYCEGRYNR